MQNWDIDGTDGDKMIHYQQEISFTTKVQENGNTEQKKSVI